MLLVFQTLMVLYNKQEKKGDIRQWGKEEFLIKIEKHGEIENRK